MAMNMVVVEIEAWLNDMDIYDYDICDGVVHVVGDVDLRCKKLKKIPVQFGYVSGNFSCSDNKLTSLDGCPVEIGGDFVCYANQLLTLDGGPSEVSGDVYCSFNNLTSLVGCPVEVGGNFDCSHNELSSLEGCPVEVGGRFYCNNNRFKVKPDVGGIKIGGDFVWN